MHPLKAVQINIDMFVAFRRGFRNNRLIFLWTTYLKSAYKIVPKSRVRCIFDEKKSENIGHLKRWLPVIFCRPLSDLALELSLTLMPLAYQNFHQHLIFNSFFTDFAIFAPLAFLQALLASLITPIALMSTLIAFLPRVIAFLHTAIIKFSSHKHDGNYFLTRTLQFSLRAITV